MRVLFNTGTVDGLTDGQLLERFAESKGRGESAEPAFAALVARHGPMVHRVCRAVLRDDHLAQDAFQATFLVLVRKARSLWVRDSLGPWLHRVGYRIAVRARVASDRRTRAEQRAAEIATDRLHAPDSSDLAEALTREIDCLADRYRSPIILCDLEGQSYEEAARRLSCPVGTLKSRLARGREQLRYRLTRRGLAPSGSLGPAIFRPATGSAISSTLIDSTTESAIGFTTGGSSAGMVPVASISLARAFLKGMTMTKLKVIGILFAAGTLATGAGLVAIGGMGPQEPTAKPSTTSTKKSEPESKPTGDRRMAELLAAKYRISEQTLKEIFESVEAGSSIMDSYYDWSKRVMESQIAAGQHDEPIDPNSKSIRVKAARAHRDRMLVFDKRTQAKVQFGNAHPVSASSSSYYLVEAEAWVFEAEVNAGLEPTYQELIKD